MDYTRPCRGCWGEWAADRIRIVGLVEASWKYDSRSASQLLSSWQPLRLALEHLQPSHRPPVHPAHRLDELDEILEYKWLESERAGFDIGMDRSIREWLHKHYVASAAAHPPPPNPARPS